MLTHHLLKQSKHGPLINFTSNASNETILYVSVVEWSAGHHLFIDEANG